MLVTLDDGMSDRSCSGETIGTAHARSQLCVPRGYGRGGPVDPVLLLQGQLSPSGPWRGKYCILYDTPPLTPWLITELTDRQFSSWAPTTVVGHPQMSWNQSSKPSSTLYMTYTSNSTQGTLCSSTFRQSTVLREVEETLNILLNQN